MADNPTFVDFGPSLVQVVQVRVANFSAVGRNDNKISLILMRFV